MKELKQNVIRAMLTLTRIALWLRKQSLAVNKKQKCSLQPTKLSKGNFLSGQRRQLRILSIKICKIQERAWLDLESIPVPGLKQKLAKSHHPNLLEEYRANQRALRSKIKSKQKLKYQNREIEETSLSRQNL